MADSQILSLYIVHTCIIGIGNRPFPETKGNLRPAWFPIFRSNHCFSDSGTLVRDNPKDQPLPSNPFVRNLGSFYFGARNSRIDDRRCHRHKAASPYHKPASNIYNLMKERAASKTIKSSAPSFFGYDPTSTDERMNSLYYELCRPLYLQTQTEDDVQAEGRIFIHVYPSGYIVLHLAISLTWTHKKSLQEVSKLIQETRPWRPDCKLTWSSRVANGHLPDIIEAIRQNLQQSLYENSDTVLEDPLEARYWKSALKIMTTGQGKQIASDLLRVGNKYEDMDIDRYSSLEELDSHRWLLCSRLGLVYVVNPDHNRKNLMRFFWRILILAEFVALKRRIYDDYSQILRSEIEHMRDYRLSTPLEKIRKEGIEGLIKFSVYDDTIPKFINTLEHVVNKERMKEAFYRKIYHVIANGTGFDEHQNELLKYVQEWEAEVAKWVPEVRMMWEDIISPLRSLFAALPIPK